MVRMFADRALLRKPKSATTKVEQLASGLYVPTVTEPGKVHYEVVQVGPGRMYGERLVPMEAKVGDQVIIRKGAGLEIS